MKAKNPYQKRRHTGLLDLDIVQIYMSFEPKSRISATKQ